MGMLAITRDGTRVHTHTGKKKKKKEDSTKATTATTTTTTTATRTISDLLSNDYSIRLLIRHARWFRFPELQLR